MKKRRRRERPKPWSQVDNIPPDVTLEILSRLPPKSIMRHRCVSKLWSYLTSLPSFINSFTSRSTSRPPTLMVTLSSESAKYVLFFPTTPKPSSYSPLYSYEITNLDWKDSRSESIHGLILTPVFKIWNPTLRQFLALPHPPAQHSSSRGWSSYLGYDPLECRHKVLCVVSKIYSGQPLILTLGAQESWRIISEGRCPIHRPTGGYGRCVNGILYYRACLLGDDQEIIMSFDVKSENFNIIKLPEGSSQLYMIPYEGRVALVAHDYHVVKLYILKDAHGHEWKSFIFNVPSERVRMESMRFRGTTDAGEFIFAAYRSSEDLYIIYFDRRRNSTRVVFLQRYMDDFRRCCGLASNSMLTMQVFPNHI
ncbi:putative F-box protein At1g50870 [Brassica napus]|uniref:putative F-box protein At1g50870 n=1 Tax=Brassica napus TaxID=3708 RepID=UPI00207AFA71|nr:putative F-box protein At1g50870 [Brassica napus]